MSTSETSTAAATAAATTAAVAGTTAAGTTAAGTTAATTAAATVAVTTTAQEEEEDQICNENKDLQKFLTGLLLLLVFGLLIYYIWKYLNDKKMPTGSESSSSISLGETPALTSEALIAAARGRGPAPAPRASRPGTQYGEPPAYDLAGGLGRK